jgi:hypothetical protein
MRDEVIYGLYGTDCRTCLYIGRTKNPRNRNVGHICQQTTRGIEYRFIVLCQPKYDRVGAVEKMLIEYYKSIGQAKFNKPQKGVRMKIKTPDLARLEKHLFNALRIAAGIPSTYF